ncbi:MAG: DUF485 domain-containing protein [Planctomycetes bacterium]|nr:DUF485 domain-containing protein [Planctomycetota bacterium]
MFVSTRNSRIGLMLFAIYLVLYGGFVLLAAFSPQTMEATPLAGVNLAIWYGFGLIVAAILLALVYGWACRASERGPSAADGARHNFAPKTPHDHRRDGARPVPGGSEGGSP